VFWIRVTQATELCRPGRQSLLCRGHGRTSGETLTEDERERADLHLGLSGVSGCIAAGVRQGITYFR
jgi:hypothetical protein